MQFISYGAIFLPPLVKYCNYVDSSYFLVMLLDLNVDLQPIHLLETCSWQDSAIQITTKLSEASRHHYIYDV